MSDEDAQFERYLRRFGVVVPVLTVAWAIHEFALFALRPKPGFQRDAVLREGFERGAQWCVLDIAHKNGTLNVIGSADGMLDMFIPGWRKRVDEYELLLAEVKRLRAEVAELDATDAEAKLAIREDQAELTRVRGIVAAVEAVRDKCGECDNPHCVVRAAELSRALGGTP